MRDEYQRIDYDIPIQTEDEFLKQVKQVIKYAWASPTRKEITEIRYANNIEGNVVCISFTENISPPTLGGYADGLLKYGFGYIHYDNNSVYIAPIKYTSSNFYFEGRKDYQGMNNLDILDNNTIEVEYDTNKEKQDIIEIKNIITDTWSEESIHNVESIKQSSTGGTYMINFELNGKSIKDESNNIIEVIHDEPTVSTKKSIDNLLYNGWVVNSIKTGIMFISRINSVIGDDRCYLFDNDKETDYLYQPKPCSWCNKREFNNFFVVDEKEDELLNEKVPIFKPLCKVCYHNSDSEVITSEKYYGID